MNLQINYDAITFCEDASNLWGSCVPELCDVNEGIHYCMTLLADGIRTKEIKAIEVFDFLDSILQKTLVDSEIENAVAISFLEYTELANLNLLKSTPELITMILKKQHEL